MLKLKFIAVAITLATTLFAQVTPAEVAAAMGRGINLGNTLEPPNEGDWNNNVAAEANFQAYVDAGFTNVRIPVRWDMHTGRSAPYTIDVAWMNRVEQVVDWGLARGLYVTLNGHHEDWLKQNYNANNRARYDAIWRQIIERFKDKSDKLLYEIINEPKGLTISQVNDLNNRILGIIRQTEPTRIVIYGGNEWSNIAELVSAAVPGNDDQYLIGYYHSYDPWPFAGEHRGTWGSDTDYRNMNNIFQRASNWKTSKGIPVYISEFNCRVEADFNSRMRWLAEYTGLADKYDMPFAVWDDNGWFKVLSRNTSRWPEAKDILVHYYQDSPNRIFSSNVTVNGAPAAKITWNNRMTDNGSIIVEKRRASNPWSIVATLDADATEFVDTEVFANNDYDFRIYTTRPDGSLVHGYPTRLRVVTTDQAPYRDTPQAIPGRIEPEDYDTGGQGIAYNDNDVANQGGSYRLSEGVDVGGGATGQVIGYNELGEWLEVTVNVVTAGTYRARISASSALGTSELTLKKEEGTTLTTFSTPLTNSWNSFQDVAGNSQFNLEAGEQILRIEVTGEQAFNYDFIDFELVATSVENEADRAGFLVAPNPATSVLRVSLPDVLATKDSRLELLDITGKKVFEGTPNGSQTTIDVDFLPAGGYILRLKNAGKSLMRRVVID